MKKYYLVLRDDLATHGDASGTDNESQLEAMIRSCADHFGPDDLVIIHGSEVSPVPFLVKDDE